ncbi:acetylxylan esterase [Sanguibacter antarcticus]|uniref:Cephalosporin-C deacetylase n=1 Tax=Sanguibacter antarcticus TaxID=372484 RepID=A0A2A9E106_9MICO|nr:acetylxylan esterase [Sanguibacter antarcticus]PFG32628.1 cephalosporin-C deacetylase [Sanguibacter antarcticus]
MAFYDLDATVLPAYLPEVDEPADFDDFWSTTLARARTFPLDVRAEQVDPGLDLVEVFDLSFNGFDGQRINAWLTLPRGGTNLPGIVTYTGYGGGRGLAHDHLVWAAAGFAHLVMDIRGQGSRWGHGGDTPDPVGSGPAVPGFLTRGILDPAEHYYRRVFTDAVRAVDAVRNLARVDSARVAVAGVSQGGGIALAVAGLVPDLMAVMADVPFLCNYRRAVALVDTDPYAEITTYLSVHREHADQAFRTLSYVDAVNHARRASAPALFSVALMDPICPPSTVYSAHNLYGSRAVTSVDTLDLSMEVYPFNQHEGGQGFQLAKQITWLRRRAGLPRPPSVTENTGAVL